MELPSLAVLAAHQQAIVSGVLTTLFVSMDSAILGAVLGMGLVMCQQVNGSILHWAARAYIQVFRNTPLLVQVYFFYKALPAVGIDLPPMACGILALGLQNAAYLAEIFRAGLEAIPVEQTEAGIGLGFSRWQTIRLVVLPQAIRIILPPMGNQMVALLKNSSILAFISVPDLFYVIFTGGAAEFQYLEFFTIGILLYMMLTLGTIGLFALLERFFVIPGTGTEPRHA